MRELREPALGLLVGAAAARGDGSGRELLPRDARRLDELPVGGVELLQLVLDQLTDRRGNVGGELRQRRAQDDAVVARRQGAPLQPGVDNALEEEGVPARPLVQELGELVGQAVAGEAPLEVLGDGAGGQRAKPQLRGEPAVHELLRRPPDRVGGGPRVLRAKRREHDESGGVVPAGERGERVDRRRVAPVEVLQDERERALGGDGLHGVDELAEHALARRRRRGSARGEPERAREPRELRHPGRGELREERSDVGAVAATAQPAEGLQDRHVRLALPVLLEALSVAHEQPTAGARLGLGKERAHQRRLADSGPPGHEHDPAALLLDVPEQVVEVAQLVLAADEQVRGAPAWRWGRSRDRVGGRPAIVSRAVRCYTVEVRVLLQHPPFQLPQAARRLDAELLCQMPTERLVRRERVGLAAGAVQREHELTAEPLPVGVLVDEAGELRRERWRTAEREVGVDAVLEAREPLLLQPRRLCACERLRELGERRPAPERERLAQPGRRARRVAAGQRRPALLGELHEAVEVERLAARIEHVARSPRPHQPLRQLPAQLGDEDLHHLRGALGRVVAPEGVDEPRDRDDATGLEEQEREKRLLLPAREPDGSVVACDLQRAKDPELHGGQLFSVARPGAGERRDA
ncbi:MAG: hypothetical protein R3C15_10680 [Thermoleophilia bacterium]